MEIDCLKTKEVSVGLQPIDLLQFGGHEPEFAAVRPTTFFMSEAWFFDGIGLFIW